MHNDLQKNAAAMITLLIDIYLNDGSNCLATVTTLQSEPIQIGFTALFLAGSPGLAWLVRFVIYQGARALGY